MRNAGRTRNDKKRTCTQILQREKVNCLLNIKAIASLFSEYVSHLQSVQTPGGYRSGVWPVSHPAAFE